MIPLNRHYDDIIDLPRPVSSRRAKMSLMGRAAQFAPFAALYGFEGAIQETARLTALSLDPERNSFDVSDEFGAE